MVNFNERLIEVNIDWLGRFMLGDERENSILHFGDEFLKKSWDI